VDINFKSKVIIDVHIVVRNFLVIFLFYILFLLDYQYIGNDCSITPAVDKFILEHSFHRALRSLLPSHEA
jgi:hypothetical protein